MEAYGDDGSYSRDVTCNVIYHNVTYKGIANFINK